MPLLTFAADTIILYLKLLQYTKWAYINTDGNLFGKQYHTDWRAIQQRATQHVADPACDTLACGGELRRGHDDDESKRVPPVDLQQELLELLDALRGAFDNGGPGSRDGDC